MTGPPTTGKGNTAVWAEAIQVAFEYRPLEGQQLRVKADEALDALLAECGRLREQLDAARQALEVYADARHWAVTRDDLRVPSCVWIGPGAEDTFPNPVGAAAAALGVEGPAE